MPLSPGASLLHYRLAEKLGMGGMGEVWKATDTTLGREVAIKILPGEFAADAERLARFEREAKVLASLNNPGIAAIYGFHEAGGVRFLAMELVPGEDLAEHLKSGALPLDESLDLARQIAEALEAAHEQGVIHRDLKPANVQLTPEGKVKVLDFGLAKAIETAASVSSGSPAMSPTITSLGTIAGVVLGTAAYMSPEQARGKPVDKRADIWGFGCILYEMLAGRRPFEGETISDTLAAVLAKDPDWVALPAATPTKVRDLLHRCLEKDQRKRLRDMGDARLELGEALAERTASGRVRVASVAEEKAARPAIRRAAVATAIVCTIVGGVLGAWIASRRAPAASRGGVVRLDLEFPPDVRIGNYTFTPDGSAILAIGRPRVPAGEAQPATRIYVRRLDTGVTSPIAGTEGAQGLTPSADGRFVFTTIPATAGSSQRNVVRIPVGGSGPQLAMGAANPRWTTMASLNNGDLVALEDGVSLVRIPATGSGPASPVKMDLAGEKGTIFLSELALPGDRGILLNTIAYGAKGWFYRVGVLDLKTARVTYLFDEGGNPFYSPTGHLVFTRGDTLLAVGFDPDAMKVNGTTVPIASGLRTDFSFVPAAFELSKDGTLVFAPGGRTAESRKFGLVDASGNLTAVSDEVHAIDYTSAGSAEGKRFVAAITNGQGIDELWLGEFDRPGLRRILAIPDADIINPVLSRDGRRAAFLRRGRNADDGIYVKPLDDSAPARRIVQLPADDPSTGFSLSWLPDGSGLIVSRGGSDRKGDIFFLAVPSSGDALSEFKPVITGPADENAAVASPDGRWLLYSSDESGRPEIYAAALGPGGRAGETMRLTKAGGTLPEWHPNGRQIRYVDPGGRVMELPVTMGPPLSVGTPTFVFDRVKLNVFVSDVLPDGRQLVNVRGPEESDETKRLSVVLGFSHELAEKMSGPR